jgi:hypothetical protein
MKLSQESLKRICQEIFDGASMEQASLAVGCSRRLIYQLIEHSREARANDENISGTTDHILTLANGMKPQWREIHPTVYHFSWRGELSWFDLHMARARDPYQKDPQFADMTDDEMLALYGTVDRYLRDPETGERIPIGVEPEPPMADIQDLRALAHAEPTREKQRPNAPVEIYRASDRPSDPPERVSKAPPEKSIAQREREHPRRWDQEVPPLHTPKPPRPSYARPAPLDDYDPTGEREPPDTMRAHAVPQVRYSRAQVRHDGPLALRDAQGRPIG